MCMEQVFNNFIYVVCVFGAVSTRTSVVEIATDQMDWWKAYREADKHKGRVWYVLLTTGNKKRYNMAGSWLIIIIAIITGDMFSSLPTMHLYILVDLTVNGDWMKGFC